MKFSNIIHLAIDIADILATGQTTTNPARSRNLGNQVLGVLDLLGQLRDQRLELVREEDLCDGVARLAHACELRVLEQSLHLRITTTTTHKGHTQEWAGLLASATALAQEARLVAQNAVSIDILVVQTVTLARVNNQTLHSQRIHLARVRNEISGRIISRTRRLLVILLNCAQVISHICKAIDLHGSLYF